MLLTGHWAEMAGWWEVAAHQGPAGWIVAALAVAMKLRHLREVSHFAVHGVLTRSAALGTVLTEALAHGPMGLVPVPVRREKHVRRHHPNATVAGVDPNLTEGRHNHPGGPGVRSSVLPPSPNHAEEPHMATHPAWTVTEPTADDFPAWSELYRGYAEFYRVEMPDDRLKAVWSWIRDPQHEMDCLLVRDPASTPVGLAHYRPFSRPLSGTVGGFLDDLFIAPAARGSGAVDALLGRLRLIAAERGWSVVRWITADDNHRARSKYDRVANRTMWVTYDMAPADRR